MFGYENSAEFYDIFESLATPSFFQEYIAKADTVLDVGAGTGQVSLAMADAGADVVAVEPSVAMREVFKDKLAHSPALSDNITLISGTAQAFEWDGEADVAVMVGGFDHLLTHNDRVKALENISAHLCSGASIVFDASVWKFESHNLTEAGSVERDGYLYERYVARTVKEDKMEIQWVYRVYEDGELVEEIEQSSMNAVYNANDIRVAVKDAGLSIVNEWSDFQETPFEEDEDYRLVVEVKV